MIRRSILTLAALLLPAGAAAQSASDVQASSTRTTRVTSASRTIRYGADSIVVIREDAAVTRYLIRPRAGKVLPDSVTCTSLRSSRVTVPQGTAVVGDSVLFWRADQDSSRALCRVVRLAVPVPPPPPPPPPAPPPAPAPAPNVGPTARATVSCTDYTCTYDGSGSTDDQAVTRYEWRTNSGGVQATTPSLTQTYPAGTTTVSRWLHVWDAAGLRDSVRVTTPTLPASGGGAFDASLIVPRAVQPSGAPLPQSVARGDSVLICVVLRWPDGAVGTATIDRAACSGALAGSTRPLTTIEQQWADTACRLWTPDTTWVRMRRLGPCRAWFIPALRPAVPGRLAPRIASRA